jgi:very-short-patch-repair endonuclease
MKIPFEQNKSFSDCFNPETHRRLYFDFYFLQHNLCIEYDGEQHFRGWRKSSVNRTKEYYQKLDSIKNKYCIDKDIKLIRIHYKDFKNIETILKNIFFVGDK